MFSSGPLGFNPGAGAGQGTTVTQILINGQPASVTFGNLGAQNQGAVVGAVTLVTIPPGGVQNTPLTIGGVTPAGSPFGAGVPYSTLFTITNGGIVPCNVVAAIDIPAFVYTGVTLTVT